MAVLSRPAFTRPVFSALPTANVDEPEDITSLYDLIRFNAHHNPNHFFCIQSQLVRDTTSNRAFEGVYITYRQLEDAVHRCADWLSRSINPAVLNTGSELPPPVGIYLESDVGLFIHLVALQVLDVPVRYLRPNLECYTDNLRCC
jgi:acyl-CoA synthetase (AMP-forming)/AMP-acid ligase II